ncbi:hypothetical protein ACFWBB_29910 [Streptomyces sp. NPDC060000]|uniref:hypothetical protein n=1 Tax=Streptomyces sp. NPDC060000 TaxID=3347031 RepID=UPI00368B733B
MRYIDTDRHAVGFLRGLADEDTAGRIRTRIRLSRRERPGASRARIERIGNGKPLPASVVLWVLEQDDPELNALVWRFVGPDPALRRALARGVPFGPGRTKPLPVRPVHQEQEPGIPESYVRHGLVGALREADSMPSARAAGSMVLTRGDWETVGAAHDELPLPGYTRWVLSVRPDCPPALRARFGSHPKFTHRLRQAGVLDGPARYATTHAPASQVLDMLSVGHVLFPARVREAEDALRPLVRRHLAGREEAWAMLAMLARLIGTFHGTVPELVVTAGTTV